MQSPAIDVQVKPVRTTDATSMPAGSGVDDRGVVEVHVGRDRRRDRVGHPVTDRSGGVGVATFATVAPRTVSVSFAVAVTTRSMVER